VIVYAEIDTLDWGRFERVGSFCPHEDGDAISYALGLVTPVESRPSTGSLRTVKLTSTHGVT
jgi:hypothetical protein